MEQTELENENGEDRIAWHPAFFEAIQLELEEYKHDLEFIAECPLNTEPLRIDVVIIKKTGNVPIKKNIARIFRKVNIVEYKSPDDYVSVKDFYQVYGYACLYLALNGGDIRDLTLTFVESRHPRELLSHLQKTRSFSVANPEPGVYTVIGDILPIQIIDSRKLAVEENIWLRDLSNRLGTPELRRIGEIAARLGKNSQFRAYLDAIFRANKESVAEAYKMGDILAVFTEFYEEAGLGKEWEATLRSAVETTAEAKVKEMTALEIAGNMLRKGFSKEETAELSGLDIEKVQSLTMAG